MNCDILIIPCALFLALVLPVIIFSAPLTRAAQLAFVALLILASFALFFWALTVS